MFGINKTTSFFFFSVSQSLRLGRDHFSEMSDYHFSEMSDFHFSEMSDFPRRVALEYRNAESSLTTPLLFIGSSKRS